MPNRDAYSGLTLPEAVRLVAERHHEQRARHISADEYQMLLRALRHRRPADDPGATGGVPGDPPGRTATVGVADLCAPSHDQPGSAAHPMNAFPQRLLNHFLRLGWAAKAYVRGGRQANLWGRRHGVR